MSFQNAYCNIRLISMLKIKMSKLQLLYVIERNKKSPLPILINIMNRLIRIQKYNFNPIGILLINLQVLYYLYPFNQYGIPY